MNQVQTEWWYFKLWNGVTLDILVAIEYIIIFLVMTYWSFYFRLNSYLHVYNIFYDSILNSMLSCTILADEILLACGSYAWNIQELLDARWTAHRIISHRAITTLKLKAFTLQSNSSHRKYVGFKMLTNPCEYGQYTTELLLKKMFRNVSLIRCWCGDMAACCGGEAICASVVAGCSYRGIHLPFTRASNLLAMTQYLS